MLFAQSSGMAGFSAGYSQTAFNMKDYKSSSGMPLSLRAAVGAYGIQFGPEFMTMISSPSFTFNDSASGQEYSKVKIHDTYFGGMIRAHAGDDPRDFAIIFRAGIGAFFSKKNIDYNQNYFPNLSDETIHFKNSIGYNAALGCSIPLGDSDFHITIEGQYFYNPRIYDNKTNYHTSWNIQAGLAYVFFNYYDLH